MADTAVLLVLVVAVAHLIEMQASALQCSGWWGGAWGWCFDYKPNTTPLTRFTYGAIMKRGSGEICFGSIGSDIRRCDTATGESHFLSGNF